MKTFLNHTLDRLFGVQIRRTKINKATSNEYGLDWGESAKKALVGKRFNTIIDIGAACGTTFLYGLAEDAKRILIEPLPECNKELQRFVTTNQGSIINCAIGEREETRSFYVDKGRIMKSSLHKDRMSSPHSEERHVRVTTLHNALGGESLVPPYLIKIDVEGHEVETLQGCREYLDKTGAVIIEVTLGDRKLHDRDGLMLVDSIMKRHGFVIADVLAATVKKDREKNTVWVGKVDLLYLNDST